MKKKIKHPLAFSSDCNFALLKNTLLGSTKRVHLWMQMKYKQRTLVALLTHSKATFESMHWRKGWKPAYLRANLGYLSKIIWCTETSQPRISLKLLNWTLNNKACKTKRLKRVSLKRYERHSSNRARVSAFKDSYVSKTLQRHTEQTGAAWQLASKGEDSADFSLLFLWSSRATWLEASLLD